MKYWQFAGPNKQYLGSKVSAGPSNSVVIDRQGMYYVAGKVSFGPPLSLMCHRLCFPPSFLVEKYWRW